MGDQLPSAGGAGATRTRPCTTSWPARTWSFRHGQVFNWHLTTPTHRIVHVDSADIIEEELQGLRADIACLCAIGWTSRPHYVERVIELLKARQIIS